MTATEVMLREQQHRRQLDAINRHMNDTIQAMIDHGLLAGVGEAACPSTTPGVKIVTTRLSTHAQAAHPFHRVPSVAVDQMLFGSKSSYWTKLKILTIYSTGESPAAARSRASLMIGEKAVKILSDKDIADFINTREPLDVVWVNDNK